MGPTSVEKLITLPAKKMAKRAVQYDAFLKKIDSISEAVFFSSHLDDAVLSTGSLIEHLSNKNVPIHVISVFTEGTSLETQLTKKLLLQAGFGSSKEYFYERRKEDKKALSVLGSAKATHLGYIDGAWRTTKPGDPLYPVTSWGIYNKYDNALTSQLAVHFPSLIDSPETTMVFTPLAIGQHTDHVIVRNACVTAFPKMIFYADFPYSQTFMGEDTFVKKHKLVPVEWTDGTYAKKAKAILEYKTQYKSLFGGSAMTLPYETYYFING